MTIAERRIAALEDKIQPADETCILIDDRIRDPGTVLRCRKCDALTRGPDGRPVECMNCGIRVKERFFIVIEGA